MHERLHPTENSKKNELVFFLSPTKNSEFIKHFGSLHRYLESE